MVPLAAEVSGQRVALLAADRGEAEVGGLVGVSGDLIGAEAEGSPGPACGEWAGRMKAGSA